MRRFWIFDFRFLISCSGTEPLLCGGGPPAGCFPPTPGFSRGDRGNCRPPIGERGARASRFHPSQAARAGAVSLTGCLGVVAAAGVVLFATAGQTAPAAEPAPGTGKTARVLLVTGMDYPGHLWRQTAPVLAGALRQDPRLEVFTVEDPHFLDSPALARYDAVVLHFQTWQQAGPGPAARDNLLRFVEGGKGVMLLHFASGAWHDEWPNFVKIAGRVWGGPNVRQHDPYGPFRVEIVKPDHPIVRGLANFDTEDELYTCLVGDVPIEVLAQAKSNVDGKYYPMALVGTCGKGRFFHTPLGHDVKAQSVPDVQELFRRGCAWAAGLTPTAEAYRQVKDQDGIRFYSRSHIVGVSNGNLHAEGFQLGLIGKDGKEIPIELVSTTVDQGEIQTKDFGILKCDINSAMQMKVFATESQIKKLRAFQSSQP